VREKPRELMTPSMQEGFFMLSYIFVMLGGALGTGARFWMSGFIAERAGEFFPLGTLVVNVSGSFMVGFFAGVTDPKGWRWCRHDSGILYDRLSAAGTRRFRRSAYKHSISLVMEIG
jgi:hypothetical protein